MTKEQIKQFVNDRDKAVATFDLDVFKKFYEKYKAKGIYKIDLPKSDKVLEITIRKMAVHSTNLPEKTRAEATKWLLERGYSTDLM